MNLLHVIALAVIQGITELFPISSLGHAILVSHWMGWGTDLKAESLVPFLVALHLGTATALLIYFRKDWLAFLQISGEHPLFHKKNSTVLLYLLLGTIPPGIIGLLLEKKLARLFQQPQWVAIFLILNGFILFFGEWMKRRTKSRDLSEISVKETLLIGTSQALALLPGFSRSGTTLVGGLLLGFTHEAAAHFSFLLATPLIFAAGIFEMRKLLHMDIQTIILPSLLGGVIAGIFAYLTTFFMMRYLKKNEFTALIPFGIYCIAIGLLSLIIH